MTLELQKQLRSGQTLDSLAAELSLNVYRHPTMPLVGFKYSQIESPKQHPIVRECRGVVLEDGTWNLVALPFRRFFNVGECQSDNDSFDWSDFTATTKEDGSLIILANYAGNWIVNTSGSFGLGECGFSGKNWQEIFWSTSGIDPQYLKPDRTYIFELCTKWNQVVRHYGAATVFLLSVFETESLTEETVFWCDCEAARIRVPRPEHHHFHSLACVQQFLHDKAATDKTFEGVVLRDSANVRMKAKSASYIGLHHLFDNGNILNPKRLVPVVLEGECDEVMAIFPQIAAEIKEAQGRVREAYEQLRDVWVANKDIDNQKQFALAVVGKTPFSGILFQVRKEHGVNQNESHLLSRWRESGDSIVKNLYQ